MPCKITKTSKKILAKNRQGKMEEQTVQILTLEGELDKYTFPKFEKTLEEILGEKQPKVILNAKRLSYISSTGLGTLANLKKKLEEKGGDLRICDLQDHIVDIFEVVGFKGVFSLYQNEKEALKSYKEN